MWSICNIFCSAYEVLSNSKLKPVYDAHGEEGLERMQQQPGNDFGGGNIFQQYANTTTS